MSAPVISPTPITDVQGLDRFRLHRAGVLNVWQYDEQIFTFAQGRLLLRGANGAGKSKTLEMLLPFTLDGDKSRITASAKHHTSLLWLMTDGLDGGNRVGYVWVEFHRMGADGAEQTYTCGVGIRASASARSASAWHFATERRIGTDFSLEDEAGPLPMPRLKEVLGAEHVFEKASDYKAHVARTLFGLDASQYDEVLRLLYWLRQPQVGEDIEPAKIAQQLSQALPQLDEQAVRAAGDTFDELAAFGEQIERRAAAAQALTSLADAYAGYARAVVAERARTLAVALRTERTLRSATGAAQDKVAGVHSARQQAEAEREAARAGLVEDDARLRTLEDSPEFRDQRRLDELAGIAERDAAIAGHAQQRCARQRDLATQLELTADERARTAQGRLEQYRDRLRALDQRQRELVPGSSVPTPSVLDDVTLGDGEQVAIVTAALNQSVGTVRGAHSSVTRRTAGVHLVREALTIVERALAEQRQAEREAGWAEERWESARGARLAAEEAAVVEHDMLLGALAGWVTTPGAPEFAVPGELTDEFVTGLPDWARRAAAPQLRTIRQDLLSAGARRDNALAEVDRLTTQRAVVAAERDPAPPPPSLPRTTRTDGRALWQVVDFAEGVGEDARAGLEAALQASGLLDAWIRPGGRLLDDEHRDIVLAAPVGSGGLNDVLVPDLPAECDLSVDDIRRVLSGISESRNSDATAEISTDGTWRLGPAHGRAAKDREQYIGATARAHERARRLELLDARIAEQSMQAEEAGRSHDTLADAAEALEAWVAAVPSGQALAAAWTRLDERRTAEDREERGNRMAQAAAHAARSATAKARTSLDATSRQQDLPPDAGALEAMLQALRTLEDGLRDAERSVASIRESLAHWQDAVAALAAALDALATDAAQADEASQRATVSRAQHESLRTSVGDSIQQLQRRIAEVRQSRAAHENAQRAAGARVEDLLRSGGEADEAARNAHRQLAEHLGLRSAAVAKLVAVGGVPGLLDAAEVGPDEANVMSGLADHPTETPIGRHIAATVDRLAGVSQDEAIPAATRVWRSHSETASGPAADHQPTVSEFGDLLAVSGRDDAGEAPVVGLAQRVRAGVDRDRGLLTEREKQQFEQHVLGELGDAIRQCRRDAGDLVAAMNEQLAEVTTSQGIRVKLDWKLRDDVLAEARAAVELLAQPVGALIPEERANLRDVLHRLIEASRVQRPELSYSEHLAAALDYRTWSDFTIRYSRPEKPGQWDRLHRRSALSQGEQKVLCYLPLFAAAAAHFTSLAGAAPYAPRLVLLDDAFPKIDVRTHPLLFGLLVQLDLDFVITSERLWGDYATVPSLAIYEALRDPNQRGIAQYEYRWDGRVLQGIG